MLASLSCLDGTRIKMKTPTDHENDSIIAQVVCDADLKITNCVIKWPGSKHDSYILWQSWLWGRKLLGDSDYLLRPWLMTPFLDPGNNSEKRYNAAHRKKEMWWKDV